MILNILFLLSALPTDVWAGPVTGMTHDAFSQVTASAFGSILHQSTHKPIMESDGHNGEKIDEEVISYQNPIGARFDQHQQKISEAPHPKGQVFSNHEHTKAIGGDNKNYPVVSDHSPLKPEGTSIEAVSTNRLWTGVTIPSSVGNFDRVIEPFEADFAPIKIAKWKSRKTG